MSHEQAIPETRGVTVTLLAALDLGPEIEGMAGRQLDADGYHRTGRHPWPDS